MDERTLSKPIFNNFEALPLPNLSKVMSHTLSDVMCYRMPEVLALPKRPEIFVAERDRALRACISTASLTSTERIGAALKNLHTTSEIHKSLRACIQQISKPLVDFRHLNADLRAVSVMRAEKVSVAIEHLRAASVMQSERLRSGIDALHAGLKSHENVRAHIEQISKTLVDFRRLNTGTAESLAFRINSIRTHFPPIRIVIPTEGTSDSRNPLSESVVNHIPVVSDDVFVQKVLLVTGSDEGAKQTVARFIENLGFKVIILDEQPIRGQTQIEKFETYTADVDFVVALLTPDDVGKPQYEQGAPSPRPSQNAIFGLAACMTKHGRNRICCLRKGELELPSIITSIEAVRLDADGGWQLKLVREMREAGLTVDLEKVF